MASCDTLTSRTPVECAPEAGSASDVTGPAARTAYATLTTPGGAWLYANASSEGLLDWAMAEIDDGAFLRHSFGGAGQSAKRIKTRLTREDAVAIFLAQRGPKSTRTTSLLAAEFRVTPKAVRDIWHRQTWSGQTECLLAMPINATNRFMPTGTPSPATEAAAARVQRALRPCR